jgi:hypothetical protein
VQERLLAAFTDFACGTLEWDRPRLEALLAEFPRALDAFRVLSRRFDPNLGAADLYQAARNAVTMHCLQRLLGVPVGPTAAILGYSLLYPYTDNYLDDPAVRRPAKHQFVRRLGDRLAGLPLEPSVPLERHVFRLVALIEEQYPRDRHPRVYDALLAIHEAQLRSVALLHQPGADEIVEISVEKGGTSVLADGFLVAGALSVAQAECVFGLGVFLQLRDDLEDLVQDVRRKQATVFSSLPRGAVLDRPTSRTLALGSAVLDRLDAFPHPAAAAMREVMTRSLLLTITDAASSTAGRYSRRYLAHLEAHSPFRFTVLREQRRRVSRARGSFTAALEAWLASPDDGETVALAHPQRGRAALTPAAPPTDPE